MMLGFLAALACVLCLFLFLYPYAIYPLVLRLAPERPFGPDSDRRGGVKGEQPTAALMFCAYNEERSLPEKIANMRELKQRMPELQIYAYSDCSTDGTNAILEAASDVLTPVISTERTGKAAGMARMVEPLDVEVLVFTDANVILPPDDLEKLLAYFHDPEIGSVSAKLNYLLGEPGSASATAEIGKAYWEREEKLKRAESITGSMMGADGSVFARRRANYPKVPAHLLDDFIASFSVLFDGLRCVTAQDVNSYERVVASSSDEFFRKRRIACRAFNTYRYVQPRFGELSMFDRFKFFSHKVLRWLGGYFLAGAAVFGLIASLLLLGLAPTALLVSLGMIAVTLGVMGRIKPVMRMTEILKAVIATAIGVIESFQGKTYQTWRPAGSR